MDALTEFGERLSELMKESGITSDRELAEAIGYSREIVRLWCGGRSNISLKALLALARYFDCSLEYLTARTESKGNYEEPRRNFYDSLCRILGSQAKSKYSLVKALDIYDSYFTNWRKGAQPGLIMLTKIADSLECSVDALAGV